MHGLVGRCLSRASAIGFCAALFLIGVPEGYAQPWQARHGLTSAAYQQEFDTLVRGGYRLVHISGYAVGGGARYAAIWEKKGGAPWAARHGLTPEAYQQEFNKLLREGYRLVQVSGYSVGGGARYAAIWEKSPGRPWAARHGMSSADYQGEVYNYLYQGYRLKQVSGYGANGSARYAAIWESEGISPASIDLIDGKIRAYMREHNIPGLSVAIGKGERLVFAKGYGYANQEAREGVHPRHLFRIASISKPITAVAIMRLVDEGKLSLGRKVFGPGGALGTRYGTKPYSDRVKKITVQHLLEHTSGWSNEGGDPMFMHPQFNHSQLITWVLDNRPPKNEPGTKDEYLNFGYSVLGRIIEQVTGQSYEGYVRSQILQRSGIARMQIAGNTLAARKPGEVLYYGGYPYGMPVARMDAHGGWVATPIDLVRLLVRVDGLPAKPDILKPGTVSTMFTGSTANRGYGKGWVVGKDFKGHNGAFYGTIGFAVIRNDGFSFAALTNTRPASDEFAFKLKGVLDDIVSRLKDWPPYDLF